MTRKDYEAVAKALFDAIRDGRGEKGEVAMWYETVNRLSQVFAQDNERFDATRFWNACGHEYVFGQPAKGVL